MDLHFYLFSLNYTETENPINFETLKNRCSNRNKHIVIITKSKKPIFLQFISGMLTKQP